MQVPPFRHGLGQQPIIVNCEQFSPLVNDGHRHKISLPLSKQVPPFWQGLGSQLSSSADIHHIISRQHVFLIHLLLQYNNVSMARIITHKLKLHLHGCHIIKQHGSEEIHCLSRKETK